MPSTSWRHCRTCPNSTPAGVAQYARAYCSTASSSCSWVTGPPAGPSTRRVRRTDSMTAPSPVPRVIRRNCDRLAVDLNSCSFGSGSIRAGSPCSKPSARGSGPGGLNGRGPASDGPDGGAPDCGGPDGDGPDDGRPDGGGADGEATDGPGTETAGWEAAGAGSCAAVPGRV